MFSFVDLRLALLLSAAVLLVRAQGEDDRKFLYCLLDLPTLFLLFRSFSTPVFIIIIIFFLAGFWKWIFSLLGWMAAEILARKKF